MQLMGTVTIRPRHGAHPRLAILGQLEARLLQADVVILSGLNEKSWPPDPGHDPWLSRPMRARFGLPSPERSIGLAAHDFVQGFCASRVILTRSLKQDGAPTVPARWLQRFDAVLQAANASLPEPAIDWLAIARVMDRSAETKPCPRPQPRPPVANRPRELPVTAIELWLQDPYSVYAKYVLKLRKLNPLEQKPDAAARGTFLHDVLNDFVERYPDALPENAARILTDLGMAHYKSLADDSGFWRYWLPRFARIAHWLTAHEKDWRRSALPERREAKGQITLHGPAGPFVLTARADRIDRFKGGGHALIDYKTGGSFSPRAMIEGKSPQLPLEGLILEQGGFEDLTGKAAYLGYWRLTGGALEGDIKAIEGMDAETAIQKAQEGLRRLIEIYDRAETPYWSLPDPERAPRFQDYAHLARVQEWSVADDEAGEAA
jgi:ATP-dependent helicase/nuclease subunit B